MNNVPEDFNINNENPVTIICPQCHKEVTIFNDNICPECGCEFEEVEKEYRLTKVGITLAILSAIVHIIISVTIFILCSPNNVDTDSLSYMDALRFDNSFIFIAMIICEVFVIINLVTLGVTNGDTSGIILSVIAVIFSILNALIFFYIEGSRLYYIVTLFIALLPIFQILGSLMCLIDRFIKPKGQL